MNTCVNIKTKKKHLLETKHAHINQPAHTDTCNNELLITLAVRFTGCEGGVSNKSCAFSVEEVLLSHYLNLKVLHHTSAERKSTKISSLLKLKLKLTL